VGAGLRQERECEREKEWERASSFRFFFLCFSRLRSHEGSSQERPRSPNSSKAGKVSLHREPEQQPGTNLIKNSFSERNKLERTSLDSLYCLV
jgi:hypothetical protein